MNSKCYIRLTAGSFFDELTEKGETYWHLIQGEAREQCVINFISALDKYKCEVEDWWLRNHRFKSMLYFTYVEFWKVKYVQTVINKCKNTVAIAQYFCSLSPSSFLQKHNNSFCSSGIKFCRNFRVMLRSGVYDQFKKKIK